MKKIKFLLILFLSSLLFLIMGCEKDKETPSPNLEITSIFPGTENIPAGSTLTINGEAKYLESPLYLVVNGLTQKEISVTSTNFSVSIKVDKSTTYILRGKGLNGEPIERSITVTTADVSKPNLSVKVDRDTVLIGEEVIFTFTSSDPITLGGVKVLSPLVVKLQKDSTFVFSSTNINGTTSCTIKVFVDKETSWMVQAKFWRAKRMEVKSDNKWFKWVMNETDSTTTFYYFKDFTARISDKNDKTIGWEKWYWEENKTIFNDGCNKLSVLFICKDSVEFEKENIRVVYKSFN